MISLEHTILGNLLRDDTFVRSVIPYLKPDYFSDVAAPEIRVCFELISDYFIRYDCLPTAEALGIELTKRTDLSEGVFRATAKYFDLLFQYERGDTSPKWLLENTEQFCKAKAIVAGIRSTIAINSGSGPKGLTVENIPGIWAEALSVSFDSRIGHDFLKDSEERLKAYHSKETRLPFDLEMMNLITRGGLPSKSLSCVMAPTGKGKTTILNSWAASHLIMGKQVLYITLEMGETVPGIGERIDANLLDTNLDSLSLLPPDVFRTRIQSIRTKTKGRLIIKEYPTATANVSHFRHLLSELRLKEKFVPDVVYVDYINLCTSIRIRTGNEFNSYTYIKYIAEELRGLAVEFDVPVVTATQTNRGAYGAGDVDIENVSESIGLPATLDFMIGLITDDSLEIQGQVLIKQLKNRWSSESNHRTFKLGLDRNKMRLYNLDPAAQHGLNVSDEKFKTGKPQAQVGLDFSGFQ